MSVSGSLLTIEEYLLLPDDGLPNELVRGKIISSEIPFPRYGEICCEIVYRLGRFLETHHLGHLTCNNSGIITQRDPDTVRGADVAFYSFQRVPSRQLPDGYLDVSPELVFEVRSLSERWGQILAKVGEFLEAGVTIVCVLDQMTERCHLYRNEEDVQIFLPDQELTLPDVLPEFRVVVGRFFEGAEA